MNWPALWMFAAMIAVPPARPWQAQTPIMLPVLTVIEGRDADSAIAYTRITLSAEQAQTVADSPALTVECAEEKSGRKVDLYVDLGGAERTFHAPAKPDPVTHFKPSNPSVRLILTFEGYKPFKRSWEMMPSGEYRYRPPGADSPNLDSVSFFLMYMYSVPVLHISFADPRLGNKTAEFHTAGLSAEMKKRSLCRQ